MLCLLQRFEALLQLLGLLQLALKLQDAGLGVGNLGQYSPGLRLYFP